MKNITKKFIIPLALASILAGCSTISNQPGQTEKETPKSNSNELFYSYKKGDKTVSLGNTFYADSYLTSRLLDMITQVRTGEVVLNKLGDGIYDTFKTRRYNETPADLWNDSFNTVCAGADTDTPYFLITRKEAQAYLDKTWEKIIHNLKWVEEE